MLWKNLMLMEVEQDRHGDGNEVNILASRSTCLHSVNVCWADLRALVGKRGW